MKKIIASVVLTALTSITQAVEINGISVADTLPGADPQTELKLVDIASQHYYYLNDAYVGAIYQATSSASPERIEFIITSNRISGRALGVSLYESMALQLDWHQYKALEPQMSAMVKMLDTKLEQGDRIVITHSDTGGAEVFVKDAYKGALEGHELFAVTAASWLKQDTRLNATAGLAQAFPSPSDEASL